METNEIPYKATPEEIQRIVDEARKYASEELQEIINSRYDRTLFRFQSSAVYALCFLAVLVLFLIFSSRDMARFIILDEKASTGYALIFTLLLLLIFYSGFLFVYLFTRYCHAGRSEPISEGKIYRITKIVSDPLEKRENKDLGGTIVYYEFFATEHDENLKQKIDFRIVERPERLYYMPAITDQKLENKKYYKCLLKKPDEKRFNVNILVFEEYTPK
ncbi:MAG: hypothetical protein US50_C0002G0011 [Candidatus Nomurabacteria bacterium GW2011_GWB1_37_5]|uniref:Uncharacterized protein n=1 Tax=Candidatus Nomurabacteria bacterium GW2011_GWB1_37_5 TaxID=1618742 RepID=A0A0G0K5M1_9BACT|nr:MAG: hypothetical protein US50_C0002G0011 [Candidatus Nomurabacteria bacterium GW2011_GWB1_37_5]